MNLREAISHAEDAWEDGALDDVLRYAQAALAIDDECVDALELLANAHAERGDVDAADAACAALVRLEPDNPGWQLLMADTLIRVDGDELPRLEVGLRTLDRVEPLVAEDDELSAAVFLLRGIALGQIGDLEGSLVAHTAALRLVPDNAEALLERAMTLFELGRFDIAKTSFASLVRDFDDPTAHHYLGLIAERKGDEFEARRHFAHAQRLDPEAYPAPIELSVAAFDAAVKQAVDGLPAHAKPHLSNVVISTLPFPPDDSLDGHQVTPSVLGLFEGTPIDERLATDAGHHQTARITLFQNNLQRVVRTHDELLEEIRITVLHEVGHLLGLDEEELSERGLD
jgi:predicted Zn-dependent protease with MMP-like domain